MSTTAASSSSAHRLRAAAPLLAAPGLAVLGAAPARADLRLCNQTESKVGVSLGYRDTQGWVTEGWWELKPKGCETLLSGALALAGTLLIGYLMNRFTDASLPWLDAGTTSVSLVAQYWLNKKYLENWILWIFVDFVYLYQYGVKELYITMALYAVFLLLAVSGYLNWKKQEVAAHD